MNQIRRYPPRPCAGVFASDLSKSLRGLVGWKTFGEMIAENGKDPGIKPGRLRFLKLGRSRNCIRDGATISEWISKEWARMAGSSTNKL